MSNQKSFAIAPTISITRSKFLRKSQHKTSFNLGEIVPIYLDEVLPGDTRKIDLSSLVRMSNPIAPIMDNIHLDYFAFFVPNRLIWNHWKEFMGENTASAGYVSPNTYSIPQVAISDPSGTDAKKVTTGSLGDYLGLPLNLTRSSGSEVKVSELPARAYYLIYNEFFRDQNIISPLPIDLGDAASDDTNYYAAKLLLAAKDSDYFTRALPYAQKGAPVTIPLGDFAPVYGDETGLSMNLVGSYKALATDPLRQGVYSFQGDDDSPAILNANFIDGDDVLLDVGRSAGLNILSKSQAEKYNLSSRVYADLSQATSATINSLRFAFQYSKMLEKDALYGTRYWEIIKGHFGVTAPDASLQRPELLGSTRHMINIDQVLQTTGSNVETPAENTLGVPGANSVTGTNGNLFSKSFTEHGLIMILAVARHDQTYGQGVNRMWSRLTRNDFYWPEYANLGAQKVLNKEIFVSNSSAGTDELVFGYQEAWAEYRYKPSQVSGLLNPAATNSLGYWTLANKFDELPTLGQTFIEQGRSNLARALSTADTGPDFIGDFYFVDTAVRPMPLYSVPGLIDHH